jgi:hypothetical protein
LVAAGPAGAALLDARMGVVVQRWNMSGRDLSRMVALGDDRVAAVKSNGKCYVWNLTDVRSDRLYVRATTNTVFLEYSCGPLCCGSPQRSEGTETRGQCVTVCWSRKK